MSQLLTWAPRPSARLLLRGGRLLDPRSELDGVGDLLIIDGEISRVAPGEQIDLPDGIEVIDCTGKLVVPAFVDPHVHLRTPGQEHKETLATGTAAAASGGYCAVLGMPNTDPVIDSPPILRSLFDDARISAHIPVGFLPAVTRGLHGQNLTEIAEQRALGAAGFTDDGLPVVSAGILRKALQYQRLCGGVIALHEEDPSLSGDGAMHEGAVSARLGVAGIPAISESTMIARDAMIAGEDPDNPGRIHIQHLSARSSVLAVATAKEQGVQITCEAAPHHLCLTDDALVDLDTNLKMNPPLRTDDDRQALIDGLRDGTIDCIATDHAPHARNEKEVPFEQAPMGTTGLETSFAALYTDLVLPGVISLELLLRRMTDGAALFALPLPQLKVGLNANVTVLDIDREWIVGADGYVSRSENNCFAGRQLRGRAELTIADGAVAFRREYEGQTA